MISLYKDKYEGEVEMLKRVFSLFMINNEDLDRNIWMLTQRSKGGLNLDIISRLPFWRYEQFVNIANKLAEEEKKERKKQEEDQKSSTNTNYNPSKYLNSISSMTNKFKK